MEKLPLPDKYEIKKINPNQADIIIEPCYPGYGTTLGNALRRVLLSSLPGAAITAIKVKGTSHEFSTLPGVKEDMVEIILNLKKLCFKLHNVNETKAILKVKGEKKVKAKDIKTTSEIEVINSEAEIMTLTTKDAEVEIELTLKTGRGYLPVESVEKRKFQLGTTAIDAIFTPIKGVNYRVENVRVGQMTNYDRLILTVTTDGVMTPEEALKSAAEILVDHFAEIACLGKSEKIDKNENKSENEKIDEKKKSIESKKADQDDKSDKVGSASSRPELGAKADGKETPIKPKRKRGRPKKE